MAKKPISAGKSPAKPSASVVSKSTPARNTPVPKPLASKREVTHEMIAKRAYEIYASGKGGSQVDNWLRAERELRGV